MNEPNAERPQWFWFAAVLAAMIIIAFVVSLPR